MFKFLKKDLIMVCSKEAAMYLEEHYIPPAPKKVQPKSDGLPEIKFSMSGGSSDAEDTKEINYSLEEDSFMEMFGTPREKTFTETMLEHIKKKGYRDPEVYKAARIDRRLFSKIVSDTWYSPSKDTVTAIVMGLKLSIEEAEDLYSRAGFALSHSVKRDVVIEYFILKRVYDLTVINEVLYKLGERTIGR